MANTHTYLILALISLVVIICYLLYKNTKLYKEKQKIENSVRQWKRMALTDDLTKLNNRMSFNLRIDMMKKEKRNFLIGILLFDIDNFKLVNDIEGHLAGDKKLKEVAVLLMEVFDSPKTVVYRFGGDEFAVITKDMGEEEIIALLLKIREYERENGNFSLSKGYAMVNVQNTQGIEKAIDRADEMMYADKLLKHKKLKKDEKIS